MNSLCYPYCLSLVVLGVSTSASAQTNNVPINVPIPVMEVKYEPMSREAAPTAIGTGACKVHIVPTEDLRQNKETIGTNLSGSLLASGLDTWATEGLSNISSYGFSVDQVKDASPPQDGLVVKMSLTRAYTWQIGVKLFGMVALKAQFIDRNGLMQEKFYRAHGDKTIMSGRREEYATALNYGLNNMLPTLARDIVSLCKGVKVESYSYAAPPPPAAAAPAAGRR
ncbi:MAG: hypothetical protein RLZZ618_909 [Pseudomonadota bacterium]|jgi:hypothetical protein